MLLKRPPVSVLTITDEDATNLNLTYASNIIQISLLHSFCSFKATYLHIRLTIVNLRRVWVGRLVAKLTTLFNSIRLVLLRLHDDIIKWKHFSRYWPLARGIHRSPVNSPHWGQWRAELWFLFDLHLNKRLSKQTWGCWAETPSQPL